MLLDTDDIVVMIEAAGGGEVALFGTTPLPVIFNLDHKEQLENGEIVSFGPYALASAVTVAELELVAGNDGDQLTLRGIDYTILALDPDGSGVVRIILEAA